MEISDLRVAGLNIRWQCQCLSCGIQEGKLTCRLAAGEKRMWSVFEKMRYKMLHIITLDIGKRVRLIIHYLKLLA